MARLLLPDACVSCCYSRLCGSLGLYDLSKERRISLRTPVKLEEFDKVYHKVTTTEDPVIREVSSGRGCWGWRDCWSAGSALLALLWGIH